MPFEVHPATEERFDDVATILAPRGGPACWCLYWRLSSGEYNRLSFAVGANHVFRRLTTSPLRTMA